MISNISVTQSGLLGLVEFLQMYKLAKLFSTLLTSNSPPKHMVLLCSAIKFSLPTGLGSKVSQPCLPNHVLGVTFVRTSVISTKPWISTACRYSIQQRGDNFAPHLWANSTVACPGYVRHSFHHIFHNNIA